MQIDMKSLFTPNDDTRPVKLLCCDLVEIPQDGLLSFATVVDINDLMDTDLNAVVYVFNDDSLPLLKMWMENQSVFPFSPLYVEGVPGSSDVSGTQADMYVYSVPKASYHSLIGDIAEEVRRSESMTESERESSIYGREQHRITKKSGSKKDFIKFDSPSTLAEVPDDEDVE